MKFTITVEGETYAVEIEDLNTRPIIVHVEGERFEVWLEQDSAPTMATVAPRIIEKIAPKMNGNTTISRGNGNALKAPIPGVIDAINVNVGDEVNSGQTLIILEAMKMKNQIRANRVGRIASINVSVGQQVNHGDVLITFAE